MGQAVSMNWTSNGIAMMGGIFFAYQSPVGENVSFIVISEVTSGNYYYTIVPTPPTLLAFTNNHIEYIPTSSMTGPVTMQNIQAMIAQLP